MKENTPRTAAGFEAVEMEKSDMHDVTVITLRRGFEKDKKWLVNHLCDMSITAKAGEIGLEIEGSDPIKMYPDGIHAHYFIPKGTKYRWIIKAEEFVGEFLSMPPWHPEQHEVLDC